VGRISLLALALTVAAMAWHSTAAAVRHARVVGHGATAARRSTTRSTTPAALAADARAERSLRLSGR